MASSYFEALWHTAAWGYGFYPFSVFVGCLMAAVGAAFFAWLLLGGPFRPEAWPAPDVFGCFLIMSILSIFLVIGLRDIHERHVDHHRSPNFMELSAASDFIFESSDPEATARRLTAALHDAGVTTPWHLTAASLEKALKDAKHRVDPITEDFLWRRLCQTLFGPPDCPSRPASDEPVETSSLERFFLTQRAPG